MTSSAEIDGYYESSKKAMLVGLGYFAMTRPLPTAKVLLKLVPALAYSMVRDTYLVVRTLGTELVMPELVMALEGVGSSLRTFGAAAARPMIWGGLAQPVFFMLAVPFAVSIQQAVALLGIESPANAGSSPFDVN